MARWKVVVLSALAGVLVTSVGVVGFIAGSAHHKVEQVASAASTTTEALATTTTIVTATTSAAPPITLTTVAPPRGSMQVVGPPQYGQTFPSGPCANWRLKFVSTSNTEIVKIVVAPPSGAYTNLKEYNAQTQQYPPPIPAERPAPAVLRVSLPPYGEQLLEFQTCTRTPPPSNPNYEFGATAPATVSFTWATGQTSTAPFR